MTKSQDPLGLFDHSALAEFQRSCPLEIRDNARALLQEGFAAGEDRRGWDVTVTGPDGESFDLCLEELAGGAAAVQDLLS